MFELHITCTKDITKLDLDFADGTSAVVNNPQQLQTHNRDDIPIDYDSNSKNKEPIKAPEIPDIPDRPAKVDDILHGLEL